MHIKLFSLIAKVFRLPLIIVKLPLSGLKFVITKADEWNGGVITYQPMSKEDIA